MRVKMKSEFFIIDIPSEYSVAGFKALEEEDKKAVKDKLPCTPSAASSQSQSDSTASSADGDSQGNKYEACETTLQPSPPPGLPSITLIISSPQITNLLPNQKGNKSTIFSLNNTSIL